MSLRQTPYGNQMKAREMFLDAHQHFIINLYNLPSSNLKYDDQITEVLCDNKLVGNVAFNYISNNVDKILTLQNNYKNNLIRSHHFPTDYIVDWNIHMDYESLIMDKLIDLEVIPPRMLIQPSARSFFMQHRIFSLLHQGYQQSLLEFYHEKSQWFSQFDNYWYFKHCSTKYRLIDILQQYTYKMESDFSLHNKIEFSSLSKTYEQIRELHNQTIINSMSTKTVITKFIKENPRFKNYIKFVLAAMEYNEELRLFRSVSVVSLIHGAVKDNKNPYQIFLSVLSERKVNYKG